ncbi:thiamine pyrophosphate-binding protein [Streptomyces nojiriensis]|uniref:thiamine pyrophosphate-binding protein n=1 Tax=Streptomyces nojiriensis TaxID=66374 RepID=UPI002E178C34
MRVYEAIVKGLEGIGVRAAFGGAGENAAGLMLALKHSQQIRPVITRHEQAASDRPAQGRRRGAGGPVRAGDRISGRDDESRLVPRRPCGRGSGVPAPPPAPRGDRIRDGGGPPPAHRRRPHSPLTTGTTAPRTTPRSTVPGRD